MTIDAPPTTNAAPHGAGGSERLLRPLAAAGSALLLVVASFLCLVGSATGDFITLTSRAAVFALPVTLGLVPVVFAAAVVRRDVWRQRRTLLGAVLVVYCVMLGGVGMALAASSFGVSGPPPMPSSASTRGR